MPRFRTPEEKETLSTYNELAPIWDSISSAHFKDVVWDYFADKLLPKALVLDLGCGTARDSVLFASDGFRYVGVDFSVEMLKAGKPNIQPEAKLLGMDMHELAFRDEVFDGFSAIASLMHIPRRNWKFVLKECRRVLKSGGMGLISTPVGTHEGMYEGRRDVGGKTLAVCWTPGKLSALLEKSRFKILHVDQVGYILIYIVQKI